MLRKAELHAHFNGSIPPSAIAEIISDRGLDQRLIPPVLKEPVESMVTYLDTWKIYRQLPSDQVALELFASAIANEFARDNVTYAELRHTVVEIGLANAIPVVRALDGLLGAIDRASDDRIDLRLIVGLSRWRATESYLTELYEALKSYQGNPRLVGVDLSGDENLPTAVETPRFFQRVRDELGLKVTIHAGELGSVENVRWAVEECQASRIGHALAAAGDANLTGLLLARGTVVETCLTSNFLTRATPDLTNHPALRLFRAGVPIVLGADNPALHGNDLSEEYVKASRLFGFDATNEIADNSHRYSFRR
jgi:adenosine deaminase